MPDIEIEILNSVIFKDSKFYNNVRKEIEEYRRQGATVGFEDFYIEDIKKISTHLYEVKVDQILLVTKEGNTEKTSAKVVYVVEIKGDNVGITSIK